MKILTTLFAALSLFAGTARADILFSKEAETNYLLVTFTQDITFTVTVAASSVSYYDLVLENVYSSSQTSNWGNKVTTGTISLTLNLTTPVTNSVLEDGGILVCNALDNKDLGLIFLFSSSQSVSVGDTITLHSGTFSFGKELPLPDETTFTAYFTNGSNITLITDSVSQSVPEPSSEALFLGVGAAGLCMVRRKRRAIDR